MVICQKPLIGRGIAEVVVRVFLLHSFGGVGGGGDDDDDDACWSVPLSPLSTSTRGDNDREGSTLS